MLPDTALLSPQTKDLKPLLVFKKDDNPLRLLGIQEIVSTFAKLAESERSIPS